MAWLACVAWMAHLVLGGLQDHPAPFRITVVDADSGRGVPLVELTTTNGLTLVTDNAGVVAFDEPGLLGQEVFFHVRSHGYEHPADGFGNRGVRLHTRPGGAATVELPRRNVAERRYRVTGQGLYHHSLRLGDTVPVQAPLLGGGVMGQDSVQAIPYRGRLYWFWGDTSRASYPLGNFHGSGATSLLPQAGGLDPAVGVDLQYFVGEDGFSRPMLPMPGKPGPVWFDGLLLVNDPEGRQRLVCHYLRVKSLDEILERGLALYDDATERFEPWVALPLDAPLVPRSHPFRAEAEGEAWWYFPSPYPLTRVRDRWEDVQDPARYQSYTCLVPGSRFDPQHPALDRDEQGRLVYAWKADTAPVGPAEQEQLLQGGHVRERELLLRLRDAESDRPVQAHAGSVWWNQHRQRWVMIAQELFGATSLAGELWFAEADTPLGPWDHARKVVTHDDYSFYNPMHHPWFDQEGGRLLYFEGTFTRTFSGTEVPVPRYDYNQVMYRLDLDDPRLRLPVPVYEVTTPQSKGRMTGTVIRARELWSRVTAVVGHALPDPDQEDGFDPTTLQSIGPIPWTLDASVRMTDWLRAP